MIRAISVGVLLSLLSVTMGGQVHLDLLKMVSDNTTILPQQGSSAIVSCICDGRLLQERFPMDALKTGQEDKDFFEYCEKSNANVCDFSTKCDNCTLQIKNCSRLSQREEISSECFYRSIKIERGHPRLKTKIVGPFRKRRDLHTGDCKFPSKMRTAELKCHIYSKFVKCRQICLFGYTLQEGISKEMKCYYKDNRWSGQGFQECFPFVDCTLSLLSGGNISCVKNTVYKAPHCDVSCYAYEDKPATPTKRYTCTLEPHKWNPDLPHCVAAGSGFVLAPAPRIRDHSKEVEEPEPKRKKSPAVKRDFKQGGMEDIWR